jgi:hypothetical protein
VAAVSNLAHSACFYSREKTHQQSQGLELDERRQMRHPALAHWFIV